MSHNTLVANVKITDMDALARAVAELVSEGKNVTLRTTAGTFRTYPGQDSRCDAMIGLPNEAFDIGLRKQADGSYTPVFDHMLDRNKTVACEFTPGERRGDRHTIGSLMQRYTVCKAEKEAALAGHMIVRREKNEQTGEISILVEA